MARTVAHEVRCSSSWTSKSSGCSEISSASRRTALPIVRTPSIAARVVAELVGARLGQQLAPRAGARHRVVPGAGFRQRREDLLERRAPDAPLARGRERELAAAVLDHLALLERLAELVQVDARVDHAAVLEVLHPPQRLLDVAAGLEHELQEELDAAPAWSGAGGAGRPGSRSSGSASSSRRLVPRQRRRARRAPTRARSVRSLVVKKWYPSAARVGIWSARRSMMPAALPRLAGGRADALDGRPVARIVVVPGNAERLREVVRADEEQVRPASPRRSARPR